MKEHEKALRIFVHNIGDFAEAEQYCNQITLDQPRREKETLLLLFLTVLLDTAATKRYVRLIQWLVRPQFLSLKELIEF